VRHERETNSSLSRDIDINIARYGNPCDEIAMDSEEEEEEDLGKSSIPITIPNASGEEEDLGTSSIPITIPNASGEEEEEDLGTSMIPTPVDPQESDDDDLELEQVQFRLKTLMSCLLSAVCEEEEEEEADFGTSSIPMWHQSRATKRSGGVSRAHRSDVKIQQQQQQANG
jgi:hypothetical protein